MKFITHISSTDWIKNWYVMEDAGEAFSESYVYNDDKKSIYLGHLSVSEISRGKGIATEMQLMHEQLGLMLGCTRSILLVKKDTWMHEWYTRIGYKYYMKQTNNEDWVWLLKEL